MTRNISPSDSEVLSALRETHRAGETLVGDVVRAADVAERLRIETPTTRSRLNDLVERGAVESALSVDLRESGAEVRGFRPLDRRGST